MKGTQEPIVDKETFYKVQELMDEMTNKHMEVQNKYKHLDRKEDIFKGLLYCNNCNCKLSFYRRTVELPSGYSHYYTYLYRNTPYREECTKKNMKMEKLEEIVKQLINLHISLYMKQEDILQELNRRTPIIDERKRLEHKKNKMLEELIDERKKLCGIM